MVSLKKKESESLIKYYIKVTCALKWARKLPRKTETCESAKCVPCNIRKCTHNGFVSDLLKWALKCGFYATGPTGHPRQRFCFHWKAQLLLLFFKPKIKWLSTYYRSITMLRHINSIQEDQRKALLGIYSIKRISASTTGRNIWHNHPTGISAHSPTTPCPKKWRHWQRDRNGLTSTKRFREDFCSLKKNKLNEQLKFYFKTTGTSSRFVQLNEKLKIVKIY